MGFCIVSWLHFFIFFAKTFFKFLRIHQQKNKVVLVRRVQKPWHKNWLQHRSTPPLSFGGVAVPCGGCRIIELAANVNFIAGEDTLCSQVRWVWQLLAGRMLLTLLFLRPAKCCQMWQLEMNVHCRKVACESAGGGTELSTEQATWRH